MSSQRTLCSPISSNVSGRLMELSDEQYIKSKFANAFHSIGNDDRLQTGTFCEDTLIETGNIGGQFNCLQIGAAIESVKTDFRHIVGNGQIGDVLTIGKCGHTDMI